MIMSDFDFRQELDTLNNDQKRRIGAAFVRNVLPATSNSSIPAIIEIAANESASAQELVQALEQATDAIMNSNSQRMHNDNWLVQADYFVARAATAIVSPVTDGHSPVWEAAINARMARICSNIDKSYEGMREESESQYRLLEQFLNDI